MIKSREQRVAIARDYHCGNIGRARRLVGLLAEDFFSLDLDQLNKDERQLEEGRLLSNYDTIAAVLNTVTEILHNMETDLDAAAGFKSRATEYRKNSFMDIYGLTEDKEKAAPSATNTQSGKR